MKLSHKIIITLVTLLTVLSPAMSVYADTASLSNEQAEYIKSNCLSLKNSLSQLHSSDAVLRVNMGQIYESTLTKLITRFNERLSSNSINNANLNEIANNYSQSLEDFRSDYKLYEEQLTIAIGVDCQSDPFGFFDMVSIARDKRSQVHADVVKIVQYAEKYRLAVDSFELEYQKLSSGGST